MGRLNEKQLTILTIVVALSITGLFGFLSIRDLGLIDEEQEKVKSIEAQIRVAEVEGRKKPEREEQVIVSREVVKRDSAILPDESEINEFINLLGDFEKRSGVLLTDIKGLSKRSRTPKGKKKKKKEAINRIPLNLKLMGSMDQFLQFINLFENHNRFVRISGFSVKTSSMVDRSGSPRHNISLELETYQYNPRGGPIAQVEVSNYERRKEDPSIQQRIRLYEPAHITKYQLKSHVSRRDPLADPRETIEAEPGDGEDLEARFKEQESHLEDIKLQLGLLLDDLAFERELQEAKHWARYGPTVKLNNQRINQLEFRISETLANKTIRISELLEKFHAEVVQPFEEAKGSRETGSGPILIQREQVDDYLENMKRLQEAGDHKAVSALYDGFLALAKGKELSPDAKPLMEEMQSLAKHAAVIAEFEEQTWKMNGIIIDPNRGSVVLVNGEIYREGDAVDAAGKVKIKEILSDEIVFEYGGYPIRRSLRGK